MSDILDKEKQKIDADKNKSAYEKERDKARVENLYDADTERIFGDDSEPYDDFDEYKDEKERWDEEH